MTLDHIIEVQKEMEYQYNHFESIAFPIIAAKFRMMAELCAEMQEVLIQRDQFAAQIQAMERQAAAQIKEEETNESQDISN